MNKNQKGFAHIFLLVIIVLVGIAGVSYFAYKNGQIINKSNQTTKISNIPTPDSSSWEIYKDKSGYYSFRYSPKWKIVDVSSTYHNDTILIRDYSIPAEILIRVDDRKHTDCLDTDIKCFKKDEINEITVNGSGAYEIEAQPPAEGGLNQSSVVRMVIFETDNKLIVISQQKMTEENNDVYKTFDQILSTFKFTD